MNAKHRATSFLVFRDCALLCFTVSPNKMRISLNKRQSFLSELHGSEVQSLGRGINLVLKLHTMHHVNKFLMHLHASENFTFSLRTGYFKAVKSRTGFYGSVAHAFLEYAPYELSHRNNSRPLLSHLSRPRFSSVPSVKNRSFRVMELF